MATIPMKCRLTLTLLLVANVSGIIPDTALPLINGIVKAQRVKRNNFNLDGVSAADINQRLIKIASAVDDAFD